MTDGGPPAWAVDQRAELGWLGSRGKGWPAVCKSGPPSVKVAHIYVVLPVLFGASTRHAEFAAEVALPVLFPVDPHDLKGVAGGVWDLQVAVGVAGVAVFDVGLEVVLALGPLLAPLHRALDRSAAALGVGEIGEFRRLVL